MLYIIKYLWLRNKNDARSIGCDVGSDLNDLRGVLELSRFLDRRHVQPKEVACIKTLRHNSY